MRKLSKTPIVAIAKASGVPVSTVSRILNDKPDGAEETRRRILEVIEARGDCGKRSGSGAKPYFSLHYPRRLQGFRYSTMDLITGATAACEEQHYFAQLDHKTPRQRSNYTTACAPTP